MQWVAIEASGVGGGNDEREQTLNQLLVEMDGFDANEGVIILAATNRPDVLDSALLRPGRFDRRVTVPLPDLKGREKILEVHLKKVVTAADINPRTIARGTPRFSGADLANLINEAALLAARHHKRMITMIEVDEARDKILMGRERRLLMTEKERKLTAYHEAGHALLQILIEGNDPIHKATILPRGPALGMVQSLPENDSVSQTRKQIKADIAAAYGGRIAEELFFGVEEVTTGAMSDLQYATRLARAYVMKAGLHEDLGAVAYEQDDSNSYSGVRKNYDSEKMAEKIDMAVRGLLDEIYDLAYKTITKNKSKLVKIAEALLEYETLTGKEISDLLAGKKITPQSRSTDAKQDEPKSSFKSTVTSDKKKVVKKKTIKKQDKE